ncbi:MAG: ABC transporter ATP-binding protein [Actinomycetota bacterium]
MNGALSLRDVGVRFNGTQILDGVSLDVAEGEWVGLLGPNGAGKTTLLRAISGVIDFEGSVTTGEGDARDLGRREIARLVALVPQNPVLPPGMRVVDYVLLGRTPHSSILAGPASHDLDAVAAVLGSLSLTGFLDREVTTLSGGELQRVVIARALAQESPILLLDEPTTALDVGKQMDVLELVDRLRRERTLTVVSAMHDLTIAGQFPDRLVMLSRGSIVAEGKGREVLDPDLIRRHYGADVRILDDGSGGIAVIPVRGE